MNLYKLHEKFADLITSFLTRILPDRTKRLVLLSSLTARLRDTNFFDQCTIEKLNKLMVLASNPEAIGLPVHLSKVIWQGKDVKYIMHSCFLNQSVSLLANGDESARYSNIQLSITNTAMNIIDGMPSWLRYGKKDEIMNDIVNLLNNYEDIVSV